MDHCSISWEDFKNKFVLPLVHQLGARTYEIISGADGFVDGQLAARTFLDGFETKAQPGIRTLMRDFLGSHNEDVRAYILGTLHAFFLIEATGLSEEAVEHISKSAGQTRSLTILCDTNFIFSLVGLHENPSDDSADALHSLIRSLASKLKIRLFVLPITVDETKRTIHGHELELANINLTPRLGRAIFRSTTGLSGVTVKFIEASMQAKGRLTAQDYLHPFHKNLISILRAKGIELYNESTDSLKTDQGVIDDILDQQEHLKRRAKRTKSYEALEHDTILWHFTRRKRPAYVESPLDANYWVATIDYRLLGFDAYKRQGTADVPVCIHPTTLLQMLQLWVPRTPESESALFASLRPLVPFSFDVQSERVTIDIIRALSRYENVDDLDEQTISSVLLDGALRSRIAQEKESEQQIELVKEALAEQNKTLRNKLGEEQERTAGLETEVKKLSQRFQKAESHTAALRSVQEQGSADLQRRTATLEERERLRDLRTRRLAALAVAMLCLCGMVIAAWRLSPQLGDMVNSRPLIARGSAVVGAALVWALLIDLSGRYVGAISGWSLFTRLQSLRRWVVGILGTLLLGLTTAHLFELLSE